MMINVRGFQIIFPYEYKLGHNATQITRNINDLFGDNSVVTRTFKKWFRNFRTGNINFENQDGGRPNIVEDDNHLKALLEKDTRTTVRELAAEMNI